MTALDGERAQAARQTQQFVVVVFDGVSLGIMSFAFGVFDMAEHYGVLPDLELRVVAGEPATAVTGGGLSCYVPYDLDAIQAASLVIIPNWRDPAEPPPEPLLAALLAAHGRGARVAGLCSGAFVLAAAGLLDGRPATTHWALAGQLAQMYPKVQVRADRFPARARTATPEEKPELWRAMAEIWPAYDEYQTKTDREIPVVVLERDA